MLNLGLKTKKFMVSLPLHRFQLVSRRLTLFFPGTFITPDGTATKTPSQKGHYGKFYSNLVSAIKGEKQCVVKPREAADVVRMVELIGESNRLGIILDVAQ